MARLGQHPSHVQLAAEALTDEEEEAEGGAARGRHLGGGGDAATNFVRRKVGVLSTNQNAPLQNFLQSDWWKLYSKSPPL